MKNLLKNPKARIAALAVLVLGGAYLLLRRKSAGTADPGTALPVTPDTGTLAGGGGDLGAGAGTASVGSPDLGDAGLQAAIDQFQANVDSVKGQVTGFTDSLNAQTDSGVVMNQDGSGGIILPSAFATGSRGGGASNPTGGRTLSGDGSPAAPGNSIAKTLARFHHTAIKKGKRRPPMPVRGGSVRRAGFPVRGWAPGSITTISGAQVSRSGSVGGDQHPVGIAGIQQIAARSPQPTQILTPRPVYTPPVFQGAGIVRSTAPTTMAGRAL